MKERAEIFSFFLDLENVKMDGCDKVPKKKAKLTVVKFNSR